MEHSKEFVELVETAKVAVREVTVAGAIEMVENGAILIDVREDNEWEKGHAAGAIHLGRGIIERDIISAIPEKNAEIILYCGGGYRSALAAESLQKMGYSNVHSMIGGWKAWKGSDAPTQIGE
ncbi:MAG: sulfurtransferase [Acidobacteria bacterium]|nr:sulfurtransferase [Acidobacteriota bacterium]